jgi:hypothetical protein
MGWDSHPGIVNPTGAMTVALLNAAPPNNYTDRSSIMGDIETARFHPSAPAKAAHGWIDVNNVVTNGTYTISAIGQTNPANPQALRIRLPAGNGAPARTYWIDLKQPTGLDTLLGDATFQGTYGNWVSGPIVRYGDNGDVIDMAAGTAMGAGHHFGLIAGRTYTDPADTNVKFSFVSKTAGTATVTISGLDATTVAAAPVVAEVASTADTSFAVLAAAGSTESYTDIYTGPALTFTDTGLTANTEYFYRYRGANADGPSVGYSPVLAVTTGTVLEPPENPTVAPTASTPTASEVTITMPALARADEYVLQRATPTATSPFETVARGPDRVFTDSGLTAATTYFYRYRGHNSASVTPYTWSPNRQITTQTGGGTGNVRPYSAYKLRQRSGARVAANMGSGEYGPNNANAICARIASMGMGHIRGMFNQGTATAWANACDANGLKWLMTLVPEAGPANAATKITDQTLTETRNKVETIRDTALYARVCGGLEGANEPNHRRDGGAPPSDWYVQATDHQRVIHNTARPAAGTTSAIRNVKIVGPSLHDGAVDDSGGRHWTLLADQGIADLQDMAGLHTYPGGSWPERKLDVGESGTGPGRITYIYNTFGTNYPVWCTEWGYHNAKGWWRHPPVPFDIAARYAPRGFLQFVTSVKGLPTNGRVRDLYLTYFESLDNPTTAGIVDIGTSGWYNSSDHEKFFGMYNVPNATPSNWTPKAIVGTMQDFLGAMRDPATVTADYTPTLVTCNVTTTAASPALQWQVVANKAQSDAGTATLWIWRNKDIWTRSATTSAGYITVPSINVNVEDRVGTRQIQVNGDVQRLDLR